VKVEDWTECGRGFDTPQAKWFSRDAHDFQPSCIWPQLGHQNVDEFDPRVCSAQEVFFGLEDLLGSEDLFRRFDSNEGRPDRRWA